MSARPNATPWPAALTGLAVILTWPGRAEADSITPLQRPNANYGIVAVGMSADASVIVGTQNSAFGSVVVWEAAGNPTTVSLNGINQATGISGDGRYLLGYNFVNTSAAWVYDRQTQTQTLLPVYLTNFGTQAHAASADGSVLVGSSGQFAVKWSGPNWSTVTNLGSFGGSAAAYGIDASGTITVGKAAVGLVDHAFFHDTTMHSLNPNGATASEALAISADASTIVGSVLEGNGNRIAWAWTGANYGTSQALGSLGGTVSTAAAVSADGSVIVGAARLANDTQTHAFRHANGTMADLNTLLIGAGVNMTGIVLTGAVAVSADGHYILANDDGVLGNPNAFQTGDTNSYLVYYTDKAAGLTTKAAQQASVDSLGRDRQRTAIATDPFTSLLIGDLDRQRPTDEIGAFGLVGSAVGGLRGRGAFGPGFTLTGGVWRGVAGNDRPDFGRGLTGAIALRYDFVTPAAGIRPFLQGGGSWGALDDLTFRRRYANGAGHSVGLGHTAARTATVFGRVGVTLEATPQDQMQVSAELGQRWLRTDAYAEAFSPKNPFPATVASGTDKQTTAKIAAAWTHDFRGGFDMTLRAAYGGTVAGSSGLHVATTGFGTLSTDIARLRWAEIGARAGWAFTPQARLDLYATALTGDGIGRAVHVGAGLRYGF